MYLLLVCLLGVLLREYYYLHKQQLQIYALQFEYQKYLAYYKQALSKYIQDQPIQELLDPQNLSNNEFFFAQSKDMTEKNFLLVNRQISYLKQAASQFGTLYNIPSIEQLYEVDSHSSKQSDVSAKKRIQLQWPIEKERFWISSKFGPRKKRDGSRGFHYGLDMAALKGTLVKAAHHGSVIEAGYSSQGYGNCIVIRHIPEKIITRYAHLDSILVKLGDIVKTGDTIGKVGNTGFVRGINGDTSNATHLHFEVMVADKKRIDPLLLLT